MAVNVNELTALDVSIDIAGELDGFVVENYFEDHTDVTYETPAFAPPRSPRFEIVARDAHGNTKTFIVDVREA